MKEAFLHYLWKTKQIPQNSTLTSGERLLIQSFGAHNALSGPDFCNVRLQIGNQQWAGNVEMHLKSSHWYAHHHEQDKAYNNVILHIVWQHDVEVFNGNGQVIPTLELQNQIDTALLESYKGLLFAQNNFIPCEKHFAQAQQLLGESWHKRLFSERLQLKSQLIDELLAQTYSDWEQVLFVMLLKNVGGKVNGDAFAEMGKRLDFSVVRKEAHNPLRLEALLFGQLNLLETPHESTHYKALSAEYQYMQAKYALVPSSGVVHFTGLRPQGFPTIRLSQLAQLYAHHKALFARMMQVQNLTQLKKLFDIAASAFWDTHYTFGKTSAKASKKISSALVQLIWINTLLPVKYAYFKSLHKDVSDQLLLDLQQLPPEKNTLIEQFKSISTRVKSAFDTQVLLQQHRYYCLPRRCLDCAVGSFLLKHRVV